MYREKPKFKVGDIISWEETLHLEKCHMLITEISYKERPTYHGINLVSSDTSDWITVEYTDNKVDAVCLNSD